MHLPAERVVFWGVMTGVFWKIEPRPEVLSNIDYRCADKKKNSWRVERRHWRHLIGFDSLFQKILVFTPKKWTVKPRDAIENTAF
jgi:hypothetical protein